jgi:hypothetical protein
MSGTLHNQPPMPLPRAIGPYAKLASCRAGNSEDAIQTTGSSRPVVRLRTDTRATRLRRNLTCESAFVKQG